MNRLATIWAGFFGTVAVVLGALAAHALPDYLNEAQIHSFEVAVDFQLYHALALLAIGLAGDRFQGTLPVWTARLFVIGTMLFSWSIFFLSTRPITGLEGIGWMGPVTPIGGLLLIVGWALILIFALRSKR